MEIILLLFSFLLILTGVFGDTKNVSVKEGQPVTLQLNPEDIKGASSLLWKKMNDIPDIIGTLINKESQVFDTKEHIFGDRLKLNNQTGSLTITNITSQHSGLYDAVIKASAETTKSFKVSVIEVKSKSVMEGGSVTLHTDIQSDDVKWKFNGADLTDSRLANYEVNHTTGDLNISNIKRDQSGEYEVWISGTLHRTFSVIVVESGQRSNGEKTGPGLLVVLILMGIFLTS